MAKARKKALVSFQRNRRRVFVLTHHPNVGTLGMKPDGEVIIDTATYPILPDKSRFTHFSTSSIPNHFIVLAELEYSPTSTTGTVAPEEDRGPARLKVTITNKPPGATDEEDLPIDEQAP